MIKNFHDVYGEEALSTTPQNPSRNTKSSKISANMASELVSKYSYEREQQKPPA